MTRDGRGARLRGLAAGRALLPLGRRSTEYPGHRAMRSADAWIYLAGLARETARIRLGTLVSPVTFRHPSVLAKMAATLDHLSDGRAELGIGAGWLEPEHSAYGFDFPPRRPPRRPGRRAAAGHHRPVEPGPVQPHRQGVHAARPPLHAQARPAAAPDDHRRRPHDRRAPAAAGRALRRRVRHRPAVARPGRATCARDSTAPASRTAATPPTVRAVGVRRRSASAPPSAKSSSTCRPTGDQPAVRAHDGQPRQTWIIGTPDQVQRATARPCPPQASHRALVSVNCDLHREMLPLPGRKPTLMSSPHL